MRYLIIVSLLLSACSRRDSSPAVSASALPASWTRDVPGEDDKPSQAASASVESAFRANVEALSSLAELNTPSPALSLKDWTPWHLDGMTASFSVTEEGAFGALLFAGTESVKATWQKKTAPRARRPNTVRLSSALKPGEIHQKLEDAVRGLLLTGKVKDSGALRANLHHESVHFAALARSFDGMNVLSGWRVAGLQLTLAVSASGQVTPAMGAGGTLSVILDWDVSSSPAAANAEAAPGAREIRAMANALAREIPQAVAGVPEIRSSGLVLDEIQLGLGIDADGNIGLIKADLTAMGRVILKRGNSSSFVSLALTPDNRLRHGLRKALRMATFFTKAARQAEYGKYKLTELEAELDLGVGGEFHLATVNGTGQFLLDFDLPGTEELL